MPRRLGIFLIGKKPADDQIRLAFLQLLHAAEKRLCDVQFHFAAQSSFEEPGWSGPELERMQVDMTWNRQNEGRARGMIVETEGEGDLRHGDIIVHECFDDLGELTWRTLNEEYLQYEPHYNVGDESSCVFAEADLEIHD